MDLKYKRILLKLSGEALAGDKHFGLDYSVIDAICEQIARCFLLGAEVGIVIGGGNFWRGRQNTYMDRTRADHIGMLATVMNSLAFADALEHVNVPVRVASAMPIPAAAETYIRSKVLRHFEKGRVVIMSGGTGSPFFSTDTAAALRSAELGADVLMKATLVDGVYDCDPNKNPNAVKYDTLTFQKILEDNLTVVDATAASMCKENGTKLLVFNLSNPENIYKAIVGENIGTLVI